MFTKSGLSSTGRERQQLSSLGGSSASHSAPGPGQAGIYPDDDVEDVQLVLRSPAASYCSDGVCCCCCPWQNCAGSRMLQLRVTEEEARIQGASSEPPNPRAGSVGARLGSAKSSLGPVPQPSSLPSTLSLCPAVSMVELSLVSQLRPLSLPASRFRVSTCSPAVNPTSTWRWSFP